MAASAPPSSRRRAGRSPARAGHANRVSLLDAARMLVQEVLRNDASADATMGAYFREHRQWGPRDREWLADGVYGVLRRKSTMLQVLHDQPAVLAAHGKETMLVWMGWPESQLGRLNIDDNTMALVRAARDRHAEQLAGPEGHNLPMWVADKLRRQEPDLFDALAASLLEPAPLDLRVNVMKASRDDVQRLLAQQGFASEPTPWSPWGLRMQGKPSLAALDLVRDGLVEVQDEGSQLLALVTGSRRGDMVADFCAGGGGKTLALGAAMRNTGRVYAIDTSAARLAAMAPRLARSGLSKVYTMAIEHERDVRLDTLAGKLDRVLVDAPCSGLGTLRRHPALKWSLNEGHVASMVQQQRSILAAAAGLVKAGGLLVYATCSLLEEENDEVVKQFLASNRAFVIESPLPLLRSVGSRAHELLRGNALVLRPHRHGTDGFFAATMRREV